MPSLGCVTRVTELQWTHLSRRRKLRVRTDNFAIAQRKSGSAQGVSGDSSSYGNDPGGGRVGDVANQHLHPDGRRYQEFTQHSRVRGLVDLGSADVRIDRSDTRTQDAGVDVIVLPAAERHSSHGDG